MTWIGYKTYCVHPIISHILTGWTELVVLYRPHCWACVGRHGCNIPPVKWSLTAAPMGILVQAHGQVWVGLALLVDVGLLWCSSPTDTGLLWCTSVMHIATWWSFSVIQWHTFDFHSHSLMCIIITWSPVIRIQTTGYQRQLNYKHSDGGYSTFGRGEGNTWWVDPKMCSQVYGKCNTMKIEHWG